MCTVCIHLVYVSTYTVYIVYVCVHGITYTIHICVHICKHIYIIVYMSCAQNDLYRFYSICVLCFIKAYLENENKNIAVGL